MDEEKKIRGVRLFKFMFGRFGFEARLAHWREPYWWHIDKKGDMRRIEWLGVHSSFRPAGGSVHSITVGPLMARVAAVKA